MPDKNPTVARKIRSIIEFIWTVTVIILGTTFGALHGWQGHGIDGAIALGFVGFVVGALLSRSTIILELFLGP